MANHLPRMANYQYVKTGKITEKWLNYNDFQYDKIMSDYDGPAYSHRFPAYKYEGTTVLDAVITIWPSEDGSDNVIRVNCYEHNTRNYFARFYYWEFGQDNEIMSIINRKIERRMNDLGIDIIIPEENFNGIKE